MWLKFGTQVSNSFNIHQKNLHRLENYFPFLGHFYTYPTQRCKGLEKMTFSMSFIQVYIPIDSSRKTIQRTFKRVQSISPSISRYKTSKLTNFGTFEKCRFFLNFELKYLEIEEEIDYTRLKVLYIVFLELSIGI